MYKVTCLYGGMTYTLHDPTSDVLTIYDDEVVTADNAPGSFSFSMSYDHPYLDKVVGLSSDIRVYEDSEEIFRGRPIDDGEDLYRMRKFTCEGELAFLYDSIQPRRELHNVTPLQFFRTLLTEHNAQVSNYGPIDKTFEVGVVTVVDNNDSLYRYTNRETTLDDILDKIVGRLGGHLKVRKSGTRRYLDILADVDTVEQPIQLGENLIDYARDTDYTNVATACIPLGAMLEETEIAALDAYLTIESVNDGSDTIQINSAVERYGFICKIVQFDDITVPANLKTAGLRWLTDEQYANMTLDLTAVDLHTLGYDVTPIRANTKVRVVSEPHGMDRYFDVSQRTYHLTQPEADTVTFGSSYKARSYTSASASKNSAVKAHIEQARQTIDAVIEGERDNISNIINQATHGYVVLDPNDGPERILIMDTNSVSTAQKMWKWDMNGLAYSKTGINGPWGTAITMNGEISASYIVTGELDAKLIKVGRITDATGNNFWDMETGEFQLASTTKVGNSTIAKASDLESLVVSTDVEYGNSDSVSVAPTTWTTHASWEQGKYLWTRTKMTLEDGTVQYSAARRIANGNGIGVSKVTEQYYLSTSNTTQEGGSWVESQPTWVSGRYYWTRSKIDWADGTTTYTSPLLARALTSGNQSTNDLDDSFNQQKIFNRLTNNGETQGIYLSNGKLYINATYIATGILADVNNNTTFNLSTGALTMKKGSIDLGNGSFSVDVNGHLTAGGAELANAKLLHSVDIGFGAYGDTLHITIDGSRITGMDGNTTYGYIDFDGVMADGEGPIIYGKKYIHLYASQIHVQNNSSTIYTTFSGTKTFVTSASGNTATYRFVNGLLVG